MIGGFLLGALYEKAGSWSVLWGYLTETLFRQNPQPKTTKKPFQYQQKRQYDDEVKPEPEEDSFIWGSSGGSSTREEVRQQREEEMRQHRENMKK